MSGRLFVKASAVIAVVIAGTAWADCGKRVDEARDAIKQAEAAVGRAKESGKNAAKNPLAKSGADNEYEVPSG